MRVGIVEFPGSTGARDVAVAYQFALNCEVGIIPSSAEVIRDFDLLVIPGGYAFADALRPGALTRLTPVAPAIRRFARNGRVLGLGNGFQILCELGLLSGVLLPNISGEALAETVSVRFEGGNNFLSSALQSGSLFQLPIFCSSGLYYADKRTLTDLEEKGQIVFRYTDKQGEYNESIPFNGSLHGIAGVSNAEGNVVGLMPRPDRAADAFFGSDAGLALLRASIS